MSSRRAGISFGGATGRGANCSRGDGGRSLSTSLPRSSVHVPGDLSSIARELCSVPWTRNGSAADPSEPELDVAARGPGSRAHTAP